MNLLKLYNRNYINEWEESIDSFSKWNIFKEKNKEQIKKELKNISKIKIKTIAKIQNHTGSTSVSSLINNLQNLNVTSIHLILDKEIVSIISPFLIEKTNYHEISIENKEIILIKTKYINSPILKNHFLFEIKGLEQNINRLLIKLSRFDDVLLRLDLRKTEIQKHLFEKRFLYELIRICFAEKISDTNMQHESFVIFLKEILLWKNSENYEIIKDVFREMAKDNLQIIAGIKDLKKEQQMVLCEINTGFVLYITNPCDEIKEKYKNIFSLKKCGLFA